MVVEEFYKAQREYFAFTYNRRKDAMLRLVQQITPLLRVAAAPSMLKESTGSTPLKIMTAVGKNYLQHGKNSDSHVNLSNWHEKSISLSQALFNLHL